MMYDHELKPQEEMKIAFVNLEKNGGQVKILPLLKGYSTTNIIQGKGKGLTAD